MQNLQGSFELEKEFTSPKISKIEVPDFYVKLAPARPTEVYNTYWIFAAKRQEVFFNKIKEKYPPWTSDPILKKFKFTNTYRASDRVSQYLIQNVIYDGSHSLEDQFFRILLFKVFNKIETWELLEKQLGEITYSAFDFESFDNLLTSVQNSGKSIYSGAYIMASAKSAYGHSKKHRNHLKMIKSMIEDELPEKISAAKSMQEVFIMLREYPSIGDFLAYQYTIDINYSTITNFSEMDFVVPGPGAYDGIYKCFSDLGGLNEVEIIKFMTDQQHQEFERLGIDFKDLWGRELQLIDCQNLFCEVDKYSRVAHPEIKGKSDRKRIKQKYSPTKREITYWYPPKWGINENIERFYDGLK